jgi:hypothetical protein
MKSYLEYPSINNDKNGDTLKALFLDSFLNDIEKCRDERDKQWHLDFVRLNIVAYKH